MKNGDDLIPDLEMDGQDEIEERPLGKYGMLRPTFLRNTTTTHIHTSMLLTGRLTPHLLEALKNTLLILWRNAQTGVDDLKGKHGLRAAPGLLRHTQADRAPRRGKFEGIGEQVGEHLPEPDGIPREAAVCDLFIQRVRNAPLPGLGPHHILDLVQHIFQGEGLAGEGKLPAVDAAHVQDVVNEILHVVGGGAKFHQVLPHVGRDPLHHAGEVCEAHHRVHGGTQLVSHAGEEL